MLKLICNLEGGNKQIQYKRKVEAGDAFEVDLLVEYVGKKGTSITFDTIILEILYNDDNFVLTTDPRSRPLPGELAGKGSVDAFNFRPLTIGSVKDKRGPFSEASLLTLRHATGDASGPYKTATGRAGFTNKTNPFKVMAGVLTSAEKGRVFALPESQLGQSNLIVVGHIYDGSKPIATESVVSTITVVPRTQGLAPEKGPSPMADHGWTP